MNLKDEILSVNAEKDAVMQKYRGLKPAFRSYVNDKSIPVVERWDFFVNAPSELKNHQNSVWHPKSKYLQKELERCSGVPESYGRGKKIEVSEFFMDVVFKGKIWMENVYDKKFTEDDIKNALEEILGLNLEYFMFDW